MGHAAKPMRHNRTITVDCRDETTSLMHYRMQLGAKEEIPSVYALIIEAGGALVVHAKIYAGRA